MATLATIYVGNTHYIKLTGLVNANDSTDYLGGTATVTAQVYTAKGDAVTGGSCTLSYIAASNGNFIGYLANTVQVTAGEDYIVRISVNGGTNKIARWDLITMAEYRR